MGWSCHFVLVGLDDQAEVAGRLGRHLGVQPLPLGAETTRAAAGPAVGPLWSGWLFVADPDWQLVNEAELRALSAGTRLLRLAVEEHVMFAEAASWHDGEEEWALTGDEGSPQPALVTRGSVPEELLQLVDPECESGVFDVPVLAIEYLTGWRYDELNAELDSAVYSPILGLRLPAQPMAEPGIQ